MEESPVLDMKISVITNSDYVMNELLQKTNLGNVSGGYLSREKESQGYPGYSLYGEEQPILFGCVTRQGEQPEGWAEHYLSYVKERLKEEKEHEKKEDNKAGTVIESKTTNE